MDPRANAQYPANGPLSTSSSAAGIPMRKRIAGDICHWKLMIFAGQGVVEWSGANFSPTAFVPGDAVSELRGRGHLFLRAARPVVHDDVRQHLDEHEGVRQLRQRAADAGAELSDGADRSAAQFSAEGQLSGSPGPAHRPRAGRRLDRRRHLSDHDGAAGRCPDSRRLARCPDPDVPGAERVQPTRRGRATRCRWIASSPPLSSIRARSRSGCASISV